MGRAHGASAQAGFNAQNWAALSLFMQFSRYSDFLGIELEQAGLGDFVLKFKNRKTISESKKTNINYADLRNILDTIPNIEPSDEILIICTSLSENLKSDLEHRKYSPETDKRLRKNHKFEDKHIDVLSQVKFWVVDSSMNEEVIRNLIIERYEFWLPDDELKDLVSNVLVEKIIKNSINANIYTKAEFDAEMEERKQKIKEKDDYQVATKSAKDQIAQLVNEIENPNTTRLFSENRIKAILADQRLHWFSMQELTRRDTLELRSWDLYWTPTFGSYFSSQVLDVFKKHMKISEDARYVVDFLEANASRLRFKYMEEHSIHTASSILVDAAKIDSSLVDQCLIVLKTLFKFITEDVLYESAGSDSKDAWVLKELTDDLHKLYRISTDTTKLDVVKFIYDNFEIADEELHLTINQPSSLMHILKEYLVDNPSEFNTFVNEINKDYIKQSTKYRIDFDGWELMGGGVSNFGGEFSVGDKTFVKYILEPFINNLENKDAWALADQYVTAKISLVSLEKPDYINRAFVPFLMQEYMNGNSKAEKILTAFIKARKGIPHKTELIYQAVRDSRVLSLDQKWELLKIGLSEYGYPITIFMDQILWQLLDAGHDEAFKTFSALLANTEYMARQSRFDSTVITSLSKTINNPNTFKEGLKLLQAYLDSDYFNFVDSFDAYDAKGPILSVLSLNESAGLDLIKSLIENKVNDNTQRVFGAVIRDVDAKMAAIIFKDIIKPLMIRHKNAPSLAKIIPNTETRGNFVWLAEKLAKNGKFEDALFIAEFFLGDPDPELPNDYDAEVLEGKRNVSINTVRGSIAWVLISVNSVAGRSYLERAFNITQTLCKDKSLYVRQMSLLSLEALANNRHTTMPDSKDWFMDYSLAKKIEDFTLELIHDATNYHNAIMQHLARVVNRIRTMNIEQALDVISIFQKHSDKETMNELDTFIIFMAEFRENSFLEWPEERGVVETFDPTKIREKLIELLESGPNNIRHSLAWHISKIPEGSKNGPEEFERFFNVSMKYLPYILRKYDHETFSTIQVVFMDKYIDKKFSDIYSIWRESLTQERAELIRLSQEGMDSREFAWWPYYKNGKILSKVYEKSGKETFLSDLEFLVDYPKGVIIATDINQIALILEQIKGDNKRIEAIFDKLIERDSNAFMNFQRWKNNQLG